MMIALPLLLTALGALAAPPALAAEPGPIGFALVVGSNRPGPGQQPLRYALHDAARVQAVFTELGELPAERVVLLENPDADALRDALDALADDLAAQPGSGVLFYYSGHARASALDLGGETFPLDELEDRLDALPAELRLVVLDACQAGAISGVKGAQPAPAFSVASVEGLDTAGTAVIASSTATELSQESEALQGSYFTHHLVVGLRGAADADLSGEVTLAEAYRYAYHRTVTSTASTAVGRQHPTLETDLRGRGELVLTRPAGATARLRFTTRDEGEVLLVRAGAVAAEVSKSPGDALTLALPAGEYEVWWTLDGDTERCTQRLVEGSLQDFAPQRCARVEPALTASKGAGLPGSDLETWALELGMGLGSREPDAYTARLEAFGFAEQLDLFDDPVLSASVAWSPARSLALVATVATMEGQDWVRDMRDPLDGSVVQTFSWQTTRYGLIARGQLPLHDGLLVPYVQAGGGLATGRTAWEQDDRVTPERHLGWHLEAGAGAQLVPTIRGWRHLGLYAQGEVLTAPVIDNLLGDTRDSGGVAVTFGLRASL